MNGYIFDAGGVQTSHSKYSLALLERYCHALTYFVVDSASVQNHVHILIVKPDANQNRVTVSSEQSDKRGVYACIPRVY